MAYPLIDKGTGSFPLQLPALSFVLHPQTTNSLLLMWSNTRDNSKYHRVENVTAHDSLYNSNISHSDTPDDTLSSDDESATTVVYDGDGNNDGSDNDEKPVTWRSLPKKGQLALLTFARLSEPLSQTSLLAYMFHQLKSFDPSQSDATVSTQVGILQGSFTAAQFLTAVWWGRLADAAWMGRKRVLLIGLLGSGISCLGFGFSRSFAAAVVSRTLGGLLNSNVGVMRTMIAEIIQEKKYVERTACFQQANSLRYQSRAFLILPMCFNIGVIIGPVLGGSLADPARNFPDLFGPGSLLGGKDGVWWMENWPYALPNVLSATYIFASLLAVSFGLDEVSGKLMLRHRKC